MHLNEDRFKTIDFVLVAITNTNHVTWTKIGIWKLGAKVFKKSCDEETVQIVTLIKTSSKFQDHGQKSVQK